MIVPPAELRVVVFQGAVLATAAVAVVAGPGVVCGVGALEAVSRAADVVVESEVSGVEAGDTMAVAG